MTSRSDGGPARPVIWTETNQHGVQYPMVHEGMSFRDAAALAALPVIIAATSAGQHMVSLLDGEEVADAIARDAYAMADAVLAARAKASPLPPMGTESGGR